MNSSLDPRLTRYLLGELADDERDRLEAQLLHDDALFEDTDTTEAELIDRHARGELAEEEAERFEALVRRSPRLRERLAFARALASASTAAQERSTARPLPFRKAASTGSSPPSWLPLAWAATLVIALIGAGWLLNEKAQLEDRATQLAQRLDQSEDTASRSIREMEQLRAEARQEQERLTLRHRDELAAKDQEITRLEERLGGRRPASPPPSEPESRFGDRLDPARLLLAIATRSDAERPRLQVGQGQGARLTFDLQGRVVGSRLTAVVSRAGVVVWRQEGLPVETLEGERVITLDLPGASLQPGAYEVRLTDGAQEGRPPVDFFYEFSVERRTGG